MQSFDWQKVGADIDALAQQLTPDFEAIVAVVRGGLVPARLLASKLDITTMYCLSVHRAHGSRRITTQVTENLHGIRILLVEDVLETGKSLAAAKEYLAGQKRAHVTTAALYCTAKSAITPDHTLGTITTIPHFPWE